MARVNWAIGEFKSTRLSILNEIIACHVAVNILAIAILYMHRSIDR